MWNWPKNRTVEHYRSSNLSNAELERRALERVRSRPRPNSGLFLRRRLMAGACIAASVPGAFLGVKSFSDSAQAKEPVCIGKQTLEVPQGGMGPIDLVERNVGGDADPTDVTITVQMVGREPVKAALAGFSIPGGTSVEAPSTCVREA